MAKLPYSRVVDVTITRQDRFPTAAGFNTALLISGTTLAGKVDGTHRTKLYSSMDEVISDGWPTTSEAYKAANVFFSARVRPRQLKIGYADATVADVTTELNAIYLADSDWYWGMHTNEFDGADQIKIADWAEAHSVIFAIGSSDVDTETAGGNASSSIAAYTQSLSYDRSPVFYHTDAAAYLGPGAWGYAAARDLDRSNYNLAKKGVIDSGQAYTLKFKEVPGIATINKPSAAVQAITGFVPGLGLSKDAGYFANTYVNIGGLDMIVEGSCPSGAFIDEIHFTDWLKARTQESILGVLANNARVPYTNKGIGFLISAGVEPPLRRAYAAGLIAQDQDDNGNDLPPWEIAVDDVLNIPASQRRQRIAPDIKVTFRYAGAIHYASVTMTLQF